MNGKKPTMALRPPPTKTPSEAALRFIKGEPPEAETEPPTAPALKRAPPGSRVIRELKSGHARRRTTVYFEPEQFEQLQAWCRAHRGRDLSDAVHEAVQLLLEKKGAG